MLTDKTDSQTSLRRPLWLLLLMLLSSVFSGMLLAQDTAADTPQQPTTKVTTIYLVRHAEKQKDGPDPALTAAGEARAAELAHVLRNARIDAVFATGYARTQLTAAPVAAVFGLAVKTYPAGDAQSLAERIMTRHTGQQVLVVGHSNALGRIAAQLGIAGMGDLNEDQYDRLFVIHRFGERAHLDVLRFGAETP